MADNVTFQDDILATPPDATVVATDDVGGAHYQRMKLVDGTDGETTAAKVTAEGNLQTITPNRTASGTLDALDEAVTLSADGSGFARFQMAASDLAGTVVIEGSSDGGTTWVGQQLIFQVDGFPAISNDWEDPVTGYEFGAPLGGLTDVRLRVSAYASGSASVVASVSADGGPALQGAVVYDNDGNVAKVGGGTENQALRVTIASDSTGVLSVDDNGASLTVDGTVTAVAQPGVDIGDVTVNNASGAAAVNIQDGGNTITVDGTVGVTGVSTLTEQQSQTTHLATIAGDTTDIEAAVELIDDTVYTDDTSTHATGTSKGLLFMAAATPTDSAVNANDIGAVAMTTDRKLHVAVQDALPAGNANIGDVDIASIAAGNNNIGDVDIASIAAGDNNIGNVDIVTMPNVTIGTLPNEGQQTMANSISVAIASNQDVVATSAKQDTIITAVQKIDDPVQVLGTDTYTEATSSGMTMGAVRRDADTTLVNTTNEFGPLQMDANGRLKVEAFSGETLPVSLTSTTVTGTVAVTQSGTWDEVGINDSGNSITVDPQIKETYYYNIPSQVHVNSASTVHWDLFNADAALIVRVISIRQIPNITTAVTGIVFDWLLERTTAVGTGGTGLTAWLADLSGTALDADITARSKPSGGATQSTDLFNYSLSSEETNAATIMVASLGGLELVPQPSRDTRQGIVLRQNQGLRCVQVTASAAGNTGWLIGFTVE